MSERRHRGPRRYVAPPTRLEGEPTVGSIEGWHAGEATQLPSPVTGTGQSPESGQASAADAPPDRAVPSIETPERRAARQAEDAARLAWYQRDKPPHWG